jgi:hypothetical protein
MYRETTDTAALDQASRPRPPASPVWRWSAKLWALGLASLWLAALSTPAAAQLQAPGRHARYNAELEPHLVWQWNGDEHSASDGVGIGFRASIPILQDGPVTTINNSLAISFGLDWAHFPDCFGYNDCSEDDFWVPITAQWNFYLTPMISLFPEFGLGFRDAIFDDEPCRPRGCRGSDLEVRPVLWFGARFRFSNAVGLVLRLGTPSLQLGVSFFI